MNFFKYISVVFALSALAGSMGFAEEKTDFVSCYGETLEVSMRVYSKSHGTYQTIEISLPGPQRWDPETTHKSTLQYIPCLDEPIATSRVIGRFHPNDRDPLYEVPEHLREIRIFTWKSSLVINGKKLTNPFRDVFRFNEDDGGLLTESIEGQAQPRASEGPIFWECNEWICRIGYALKDNLYLEYKFRNDAPDRKSWPTQDVAVRGLVKSWIK